MSTVQEPYRKTPIVEATIEIRVVGNPPAGDVAKVQRQLAKEFPKTEIMHDIEVAVPTNGGVPVVKSSPSHQFKLTADDAETVVQGGANKIAVTKTGPYRGWDDLVGRMEAVWKVWRKYVDYRPIERLGVRYVNRIDIPTPPDVPILTMDFLTTGIVNPPLFDRTLSYATAATLQFAGRALRVNLNSGLVSPPPLIDHVSLLLDIDVFRDVDLAVRENDMWGQLAEMRDVKNEIFEASITDKTRELLL